MKDCKKSNRFKIILISKGFYFSSKIEKNKGDRDFKLAWLYRSCLIVSFHVFFSHLIIDFKVFIIQDFNNNVKTYVCWVSFFNKYMSFDGSLGPYNKKTWKCCLKLQANGIIFKP